MLIVAVKQKIKPEHVQDYVNLFDAMRPTVLQEDGCLEYQLYMDRESADEIFIFERWESQAALDAHIETPHVQNFFARIPELVPTQPEITIHKVAETLQLND